MSTLEATTATERAGGIELTAGDYRAVIDQRGAALQQLTFGDRDIVWSYAPDHGPTAFQGQILAPWPNRIEDGRYLFDGVDHQLDINEAARNNAIHGLVYSHTWTPTTVSPSHADLSLHLADTPGYPFNLAMTVSYDLDADTGLTVEIAARNTGERPAPYGVSSHPYLTLGTRLDNATLALPGEEYLPTNERLLPAGAPKSVEGSERDFLTARRIGPTVLDTAFTGLRRDSEGLTWTVLSEESFAVAMWADDSYPWLQVFTSDTLPPDHQRGQLAVEPMTCPPNAFVSGTDLTVLAPGESTRSRHGIRRLATTG
ncbi:aldose 1-epimerase family protein [Salinactinospora qingdaonensis]|uniref:Aldose 1-epimerase family protein n=1 Tax=Salinactinospora qingdaonensis TaxID=702744 RepID=A0ABP7FM79_9ACTN